MKRKSHIALGHYLLERCMPELPPIKQMLFLYGCIQPDQNPVTYLKGSFRGTWLRGHNYENADRFMLRLCKRLERRKHLHFWDYYTLGKLIHYTLDAFTYAHNRNFPSDLVYHRHYEIQLQSIFLHSLSQFTPAFHEINPQLRRILSQAHNAYLSEPGCPERDAAFSIRVSCSIAAGIATKC